MSLAKTLSCQTCVFWDRDGADKTLGYCHRNPPIQSLLIMAVWPRTGDRWWCGEHTTPKAAQPVEQEAV